MKTIFITAFEGVEVKNLLRTGVVDALLERPDIIVVLLMKDARRIVHYQKEFAHPRLRYAAVPHSRSPAPGLDRVFAVLKFMLIRTQTTRLRRKLAFIQSGNAAAYYGGLLLNALLARRPVRRIMRALDYRLVRNSWYRDAFDRYRPDAVVLAHLFEESEVHVLREARRRGISTIGFVNSWDKVTARAMMRLLPDHLIVFNDVVRDEVIRYNDMPPGRIRVSGIPQYDRYRSPPPHSRQEFFRTIGVDPRKRLIVYAPLGRTFSNSDWNVIDLLNGLIDAGAFGPDLALLVRFQPNDPLDADELQKRPHLKYDYPGVRFALERGVDWDMNEEDLRHLHDTLAHMSLLIGYATSLSVDAVIFDKPVININFAVRSDSTAKQPTQYYAFEHYRKALETGGIRLVGSTDELTEWVNRYLNNPALDEQGRRRLVAQQCQFADGMSARRIAEYIISIVCP